MKQIIDYDNKNYEDYWKGRDMLIFNEQEQRIIRDFLSGAEGTWFLDLGCGFGRLIPLYQDRFDHIVLADYSMKNLLLINQKYPGNNFHLIAADANRLPFKKNVFDLSLCIRLIQNLPDAGSLINELNRIMSDNSNMMLSYFNRRNLMRIFRYGSSCFKKEHSFSHKADFGLMHGSHPDYIKNLLIENYNIVEKKGVGFSYQISNNSKKIKKLIEKSNFIFNFFRMINIPVDFILSRFNLSLWQFLTLSRNNVYKENKKEGSKNFNSIYDILICPGCHSDSLEENNLFFTCKSCGKKYDKLNNIYDFRL